MISESYIKKIGEILNDKSLPLKHRFRALFTLKNIGGNTAVDCINDCFSDKSALLKHELAYCLGQMKIEYAAEKLISVLEDSSQEVIVRHEAGEALGAIGSKSFLPILSKYTDSDLIELAETCQLACERIRYLAEGGEDKGNIYGSIDPVPATNETDVTKLERTLLDEKCTLVERYRAMFALRNINTEKCVFALCHGLETGSVLFRHEVAFVLGQLQSPLSIGALSKSVANEEENPIVRHEAIEALGSIGTDECANFIGRYEKHSVDLVRESAQVALDMSEYENSIEFQYANGLEMVQ